MKAFGLLLIIFLLSGIGKIMVKLASVYDKFLFMSLSYSIACILAIIMRERFEQTTKIDPKSLIHGILIGIVNFFAFYTLLTSLSIGPASIVFSVVSLNTIIIIILSILIYKEKLTKRSLMGIVCSIIAILLLR